MADGDDAGTLSNTDFPRHGLQARYLTLLLRVTRSAN